MFGISQCLHPLKDVAGQVNLLYIGRETEACRCSSVLMKPNRDYVAEGKQRDGERVRHSKFALKWSFSILCNDRALYHCCWFGAFALKQF